MDAVSGRTLAKDCSAAFTPAELEEHFVQSELGTLLHDQLGEHYKWANNNRTTTPEQNVSKCAVVDPSLALKAFFNQFSMLLHRGVTAQIRDKRMLISRAVASVATGLLLGMVKWGQGRIIAPYDLSNPNFW